MKALLVLLALSLTAPAMAGVTGKGGGGVNQNGVYKTFYSAGLYVSPEAETEIPGSELYTSTILSLAGQNASTSKLLEAGLPITNRKFFKILEDKMEAGVMDRLLDEYARVVNQPGKNLTIFAITEIGSKITYLLPSFYKLSENEQASILFHEAYWILNPKASYPQVMEAESAFQKFVEARDNKKFDTTLLRILGTLLNDNSLALKSAFAEDARAGKVPTLISKDKKIKVKDLMANNCTTSLDEEGDGYSSVLNRRKTADFFKMNCAIDSSNLQGVLTLSRKYPQSLFLKEYMRFLSEGNSITIDVRIKPGMSSLQSLSDSYLTRGVSFEKIKISTPTDYGYGYGNSDAKRTKLDEKDLN